MPSERSHNTAELNTGNAVTFWSGPVEAEDGEHIGEVQADSANFNRHFMLSRRREFLFNTAEPAQRPCPAENVD
jgi:hypothetical protein